LREIGGDAATFCPPGDAPAWVSTLVELLQLDGRDSTFKAARREALLKNVRRFSWTTCATQMASVYERFGGRAA
jgi:glycosyltransferase involved in cell wall biosynthesis